MIWEQGKTITIIIHKSVYFITVIQRKINNILDVSPDIIYFSRVGMILEEHHHLMFC
jgi:hypothetical protein